MNLPQKGIREHSHFVEWIHKNSGVGPHYFGAHQPPAPQNQESFDWFLGSPEYLSRRFLVGFILVDPAFCGIQGWRSILRFEPSQHLSNLWQKSVWHIFTLPLPEGSARCSDAGGANCSHAAKHSHAPKDNIQKWPVHGLRFVCNISSRSLLEICHAKLWFIYGLRALCGWGWGNLFWANILEKSLKLTTKSTLIQWCSLWVGFSS